MEDIVIRYDRPRPVGCSRAGCDKAAAYRVVLLLVPSRTYVGKPWRFVSSNIVCPDHREKTVDPYLDEEAWKRVLESFDAKKIARPWRAGTRVDFDPIESPEGA